jgi:hypothetical protein
VIDSDISSRRAVEELIDSGVSKMNPLTRPHRITHQPSGARLSLPVPSSEEIISQAESSKDDFTRWLDHQLDSPLLQLTNSQEGIRAQEEQEQEEGEEEKGKGEGGKEEKEKERQNPSQEASLILLAHYLHFLAIHPNRPNHKQLIHISLTYFHSDILKNRSIDLHSAAFQLTSSDQARRLVIKAYYLARNAIPDLVPNCPSPPVGRLWKHDEPHKKLAGVFGGQGVNETYWQELVVSPFFVLEFLLFFAFYLKSPLTFSFFFLTVLGFDHFFFCRDFIYVTEPIFPLPFDSAPISRASRSPSPLTLFIKPCPSKLLIQTPRHPNPQSKLKIYIISQRFWEISHGERKMN